MQRRQFLLGPLPALALSQTATKSGHSRICVVAGKQSRRPDICAVAEDLGLACDLASHLAAQQADPHIHSILWITCPDYPYYLELSPALLSRISVFLAAGKGVFAEFTLNFPGLPAAATPYKTGIARLFVNTPFEGPEDPLEAGTILDEHDSICLPLTESPALRRILSFGRVKGVQKVIQPPDAANCWPGLVWGEQGAGRVSVAATSISDFRLREYAPVAHWEHILRDLLVALLPREERTRVLDAYIPIRAYTEPRRWIEPRSSYKLVVETRPGSKVSSGQTAAFKEISPGKFEVELKSGDAGSASLGGFVTSRAARRAFRIDAEMIDRKVAYRRSIERNIRWFENSGVLLRPDGTLGVTEWISGPDINGNRIPYGKGQMFAPLRADCVFQSGLAFSLAAKLSGRADRRKVGENLLLAILDFQRLGKDDPRYGLWNTRGRSGPPYLDDVAWATMGCLAGYLYTQRPIFLHRGTLSANSSMKAFKTGGKNGLTLAGAENDPYPHPHDRGQLVASWLYAYGVTGDRTFLDFALPLVDDMIERFPSIPSFLISRSEEATRFLLPLALAHVYTGDRRYTDELHKQATYLVTRMAECGAIQEHGSNAGTKLSGNDLGLTYDANETITDQLYTTSFAAMNLWIAHKATSDKLYLDAFHRVADYLTRIQVIDPSKPRIDGGWMRGFDYSLWEYYGSNADESWTAYCMETGWMNAIVAISLSLYLLNESFDGRHNKIA